MVVVQAPRATGHSWPGQGRGAGALPSLRARKGCGLQESFTFPEGESMSVKAVREKAPSLGKRAPLEPKLGD